MTARGLRLASSHGALVAVVASALVGCGAAPPPSQFPNGQAAIDRMKETYSCLRGVSGEAKIDHLSDKGRVRGKIFFLAVEPEQVSFDVQSPLGGTALASLKSDGQHFSLLDVREKRFLEGPATACNLARLTQVPLPGFALVEMLHGEAPVLVHQPDAAQIHWDSGGFYVVDVTSTRGADEVLHLAPNPEDFGKPWSEQRVRVLDIRVRQQGLDLYHAEMKDHALAEMAAAMVDEDHVDPDVPPSGPMCRAEIPRRIHVEMSGTDDDVLFRYDDVKLNPPLPEGVFRQPVPGGVQHSVVGECDR